MLVNVLNWDSEPGVESVSGLLDVKLFVEYDVACYELSWMCELLRQVVSSLNC